MTNPQLKLEHLLLPSIPEVTHHIVEHSCSKLLFSFLSLSEFICSQNTIEEPRKIAINKSVDYIRGSRHEVILKMLSSPIFRGWYSKFGKIEDFSIKSSLLEALINSWDNHIYSFHYSDNFESSFAVTNGVCHSWDPILTFQIPGHKFLVIKKQNQHFQVRDENTRMLASFLYDPRTFSTVIESIDHDHLEIKCNRNFLSNSTIAIRNDIPSLCLRLSGLLERETAIAEDLDFSHDSYNPCFDEREFITASKLIEENWLPEYLDFKETLQIVVPRQPPAGWRARGMTVSSYQGAVWILARGILPIFENLLHEHGHVKLRYIQEHTPILDATQPERRYKVAWRTDPRPIVGIYEGVYVHLHMLMGLSLLLENKVKLIPRSSIVQRTKLLRTQIREGIDILEKYAVFTNDGAFFVKWARSMNSEAYV